jgi:ribosomal protein L11 methyltransferase
MGYYEFTISAPRESRDAIMNMMTEAGSLGFFEKNDNIITYFEDRLDISLLCDKLTRFRDVLDSSGLNPAFNFHYVLVPEKDWNESWKSNFTPVHVGENFIIIPPWINANTDRTPIIIDPGMAFGTGHHETTRACLMFIEEFSVDCSGKTFLDIGTGTGILAIGASRSGFMTVTGIDSDPLAVDAARRNVEANGIDNVEIKEGTIKDIKGMFDVIAANLYAGLLIKIAPDIEARLNQQGVAILSGMLLGQEGRVIKAMKSTGLGIKESVVNGEWISLVVGR